MVHRGLFLRRSLVFLAYRTLTDVGFDVNKRRPRRGASLSLLRSVRCDAAAVSPAARLGYHDPILLMTVIVGSLELVSRTIEIERISNIPVCWDISRKTSTFVGPV